MDKFDMCQVTRVGDPLVGQITQSVCVFMGFLACVAARCVELCRILRDVFVRVREVLTPWLY